MSESNGSGKREEAKLDGVVDELKNVLSGLGRIPPSSNPVAAPAPRAPSKSEPPSSSPFVENGAPAEALASDADFWNGNVLGWPANADADLAEVPGNAASSFAPAPEDNSLLREEAPETEPAAFADPVPAEPAAMESDFDKGGENDGPTVFLPPVPEPIEKSPDAWPLVNDAAEAVIPEPPAAPRPAAAHKPAVPTANPWLQPVLGDAPENTPAKWEPSAADEPPAPVETPAAPAAVMPAADFEMELPIPGTKETKDKPPVDSGSELDLEGTNLKPGDLAHVACIYPEGQEKAGQAFVSKLKEAAEKLRNPIAIESVFVSAWSSGNVDPAAWAKAASLSGADTMFVLSFRASANVFRNLSQAVTGGPKTRLVYLEQTNFPTLYADILVEIRRGR